MKIKLLLILFLFVGVGTFAQKKEIKKAQDALENNDLSTAKSLLESVESKIPSQKDKIKGEFYATRGVLYLMLGKKMGIMDNFFDSTRDFKEAVKYLSGSDKKEGETYLSESKSALLQTIAKVQDNQNYKKASEMYKKIYDIFPEDTIYLYAAAQDAYYGKEDANAVEYFENLHKMGYKGTSLQYTAKEKKTGNVQSFASKSTRDLYIKSGDYTDPGVHREESKEGSIAKSLALLYLRNDQKDKALEFVKTAQKKNPRDVQLLKAEALIYQQTGDKDKAQDLLINLTRSDADNAAQYYVMLGQYKEEEDNIDKARFYYKKAIEADSKSTDAYQSMANTYLKKQEDIVKEMNTLSMSKEDTKKYDELAEERAALIKKALPYVENILKVDPENTRVMRTLYQLNIQLRDKETAQKYKDMMEKAAAESDAD